MEGSVVFTPLVLTSGLVCLTAQILLYILFGFVLPYDGPWKQVPGFTAHQAVCLPLIIYVTYQGFVAWFVDQASPSFDSTTFESRVFAVSERGAQLSETIFGMMLFWDIPCSLLIKSLQDHLMFMHHVGMFFLSAVAMGALSGGNPIGSYYASFFFGVVEFSTIWLTITEMTHPKHKEWSPYLAQLQGPIGDALRILADVSRGVFALSYLAFRTMYFPVVIFTGCVPDYYRASMLPEDQRHGGSAWSMLSVCVLAVAFTILQLHWGLLVVKALAKALGLLPDNKKTKEEEKKES